MLSNQNNQGKNFSVITNFGCAKRCFFCAFANHHLNKEPPSIDWEYLDWCIKRFVGPKVSISGGGDPLFELDKNLPTLQQIVSICRRHNHLVDLHTNEDLLDKMEAIKSLGFNQVVVSTNTISEVRNEELIQLLGFSNVRATMVYVGHSPNWIRRWIEFYSFVPKLTIRECHGGNVDFGQIKQLQNEFPHVKFLIDGDYNYYFMPNNLVYDDYGTTNLTEQFMREDK